MTDDDRVEWFKQFTLRLEEEDLHMLTLFMDDLQTKFRERCQRAYFTGYADGKGVLEYGTH